MPSITTPTLAAVRDAAQANSWVIQRDRPGYPGRVFEAHKNGRRVTVRFSRRGGITRASYDETVARGRDKRTTVIGWLYDR